MSSHFVSEVINWLLDAVAYFEVGEGNDFSAGFLGQITDLDFRVLDEGLLDQTGFCQELGDTTANHFFNDFSWLAFDLVFVQLQEDILLALDRFGRNFRREQELGVACRDVHGDILGQLDVATLEGNYHADLVAVQVSTYDVTFDTLQATDVDVFANLADQYQTCSFLCFDQRSDISQLVSEGFFDACSNESLEVVLQGQEVGLRVDFDDDSSLAVVLDGDSAFSSHVACFLGGLDGAGSTHVVDCFFDVAASLGQGLFAIHHAFAGTLAQLFDQRCSNLCHFKILLDRSSTIPPDRPGVQFLKNQGGSNT